MQQFTNLRKILVPVPLNADLVVPLRQAMHFHRAYGSEIILMNVVSGSSVFHRVLKPEELRKRQKKAKRKLKKLVKKHFHGEIPAPVDIKIVKGTLLSAILKTARESGCDLIVIKKARRLDSRFKYLKSENADKLIAEAVCPVLTIISDPTPEKISNIMIPVEVLKPSKNKVAWAVSLAKKYDARLHLVSVLKADVNVKTSLAFRQSRKIESHLHKQGIDVNKVILKPEDDRSPEETIIQYAEEQQPDMILIKTHKESVIRENYLGSFAREIIHNSPVPVFSVIPGNETTPYNIMKPVPERVIREKKTEPVNKEYPYNTSQN